MLDLATQLGPVLTGAVIACACMVRVYVFAKALLT